MTALDLRLIEDVARLAANTFVSGLWQGVVLAAGAAIFLKLVPKTTAAVRFTIWTAVFAVLAVLPLVHAYALHSDGSVAARGAMLHVDVRWSFAIAAVWLTVSLVRAVKLLMSAFELHGIWQRAVPVKGADEVLLAAGFRGVELCTSKDVDRPSVIGFFSPRILIPEDVFERLTTAEFGQIVLHELGHLRRADDWVNLLQKVSLVLVPLNPVLVWIERRLCLERELACDDDVLRLTKAPKAYATCLTNLAEQRLARKAAALSLGAWGRRSELARRVQSILGRGDRVGMGRLQARVVMSLLAVGLVGGAMELARCPQLISFSPAALPMSAETRGLAGAGYQTVTFHGAGDVSGVVASAGAHETLLKASMPAGRELTSPHTLRAAGAVREIAVKKTVAKPRSSAATHVIQTRVSMLRRQRTEGWIVLTTWQQPARRGVMSAGDNDLPISYAAVPTPGGWLVIQL